VEFQFHWILKQLLYSQVTKQNKKESQLHFTVQVLNERNLQHGTKQSKNKDKNARNKMKRQEETTNGKN
jgi:hypothetical protein